MVAMLAFVAPGVVLVTGPPAAAGGADGGADGGAEAAVKRPCTFTVSGGADFTGRCRVERSVDAADASTWRYQLIIVDETASNRRVVVVLHLPDGFRPPPPPAADVIYTATVRSADVEWNARTPSLGKLTITLDPATVRDPKFRDPHGHIDATLQCSNLPAPAPTLRLLVDF